MKITQWFFGFHPPHFLKDGKIHPRGWMGHCEAWGCTDAGTWVFFDPRAAGTRFYVTHLYEDVLDELAVRNLICTDILKFESTREFRVPIFPLMTCASVCGALVGVRALSPATLRRKLLANGAEVIHGRAKGRSRGSEEQTAGTQAF